MSGLISNWRLKLLALVLTVGLLAAVAFSENPVAVASVAAAVDYENLDPGYVIVNPVLRTQVNVFGPAATTSVLQNPTSFPNGVRFRVNLRGFKEVSASHTFYASPKSLPPALTWTGDAVPITVGIDRVETRSLKIDVRPRKIAPGFKVLQTDPAGKPLTYAYCTNRDEECKVQVTAPLGQLGGESETKIKAYVETDVSASTSVDSPNQPVRFEKDGKPIDMTELHTLPAVGVNPSTVNVKVTAQQTQASRQVALKPSITGRPACGYAVTGITFLPDAFATVTGSADRLAGLDSISLPSPIDISNATGNVRVSENIPTDNYTVAPTSVSVTVAISKQVDCSAPTPTPTPAPTPTPTTR